MPRTRRDVQRWARRGTTEQRGYRPRVSGKTTARGYGRPHQLARAAFVKAFWPGQPCAIGGEPLLRHTIRRWCDLLDLAHDHQHGGYLGLSCRTHNRGHHDRPQPSTAAVTVSSGRRW